MSIDGSECPVTGTSELGQSQQKLHGSQVAGPSVDFPGRRGLGRGMTTRQYARLVSAWTASIGLGVRFGKGIRNTAAHSLSVDCCT